MNIKKLTEDKNGKMAEMQTLLDKVEKEERKSNNKPKMNKKTVDPEAERQRKQRQEQKAKREEYKRRQEERFERQMQALRNKFGN